MLNFIIGAACGVALNKALNETTTDTKGPPTGDYLQDLKDLVTRGDQTAESIARQLSDEYSVDYGSALNDAYNIESQLRDLAARPTNPAE